MLLSKRTEYGVRAIVQLARDWPRGYLQAHDLAKREALPAKFLEAILLALRRGGFLESKIGREGGYRLTRAPKDIQIGDLIRRLEGRLTVTQARSADNASSGEVAINLLNDKLTEATDSTLDSMNLEQLVEQSGKLAGTMQMYYI